MATPAFISTLRQKIGHELLLVPTVVVIARDKLGRILFVHDRDADQWTLPGGIIEPGQAPADAAVREVWEETRIVARLSHIVGVVGGQGCETHYRNGDKIAWVATLFGALVEDGTPIADGAEAKEARFVAAEDVACMALRGDSRRFLDVERQSPMGAYFQASNWHPQP